MAGDELDAPLRKPARPPASRTLGRVVAVLVLAGLGLAALAFVILVKDNGSRGEPFAVATIERPPADAAPAPAPPAQAAPSLDAPPNGALQTPQAKADAQLRSAGQDVEIENGVKVIRPVSTKGSGAITLKVPDAASKAIASLDTRLIEASPLGPLPRVGADGSRPASVYARPSEPVGGKSRIAILVSGMGLDHGATAEADHVLAPAVTLGFAPYGEDLDVQVAQARESGHEVVLLLPMEDFGRDSALPPHALLASPGGNQDRLHWLMSRFTGYAGVGNYLGGRLLGDETALQPVLKEIATRGLYFVDDGRSSRSLAEAVAGDLGLPAVRADVAIDAKPDPASMLAALAELERIARERGYAVGTAVGLPATNALVAKFTGGFQARGLVLVPISQIVNAAPRASARGDLQKTRAP